jgi:O-antigen ligase
MKRCVVKDARRWVMVERFGGWLLIAALILLPFGRSVELPVLLAAVLGLVALIRGARPWREPAGQLAGLLFLGYWLPELLSAFTAVAPTRSWSEVAVDLRYLPMLWCFVAALRAPHWLRRIHLVAAAVLAVWLLDALLQAATGWSLGGPAEADRLSGIFGADHLKLGAMVAVLSPFLLRLAGERSRWLAAVVLLALLPVVLLAGTRAAWIMLAVVLGVIGLGLWGWRRSLLLLLLASVLGGVLGAVAYRQSPSFAARIERSAAILAGDREGLDHALAFRLPIWDTALAMSADNPLTGVGVRGFRVAYADYAQPGDRWVRSDGEYGASHAHNLVLEVLSETGALGLLCWLLATGLAVRAWRHADAERRRAALPATAALMAMLFPFNTHYAIYSSVWGGLMLLLLAIWIGALHAAPAARPD